MHIWRYRTSYACYFCLFFPKILNLYYFFKILLEQSWFIILCHFLLYNKVNQLYIYIYPLFQIFFFFLHIGHYRVLKRVPNAVQQVFICYLFYIHGFPCGSAHKESICNAGDLGSIPSLGRSPGEGRGYPLQYFGLEKSMDSVHGLNKELDTTERFSLSLYIHSSVYVSIAISQFILPFFPL